MSKVPFTRPDVSAPRFVGSYSNTMKQGLFDEFVHKFPEHKELTYTEFKKIIAVFHKNFVDGLTDQRAGVELPERLGLLIVANCSNGDGKSKSLNVGESIKRGYKVYFENWHSNHKLMKIFFTNYASKYILPNKTIWSFRFNKENRKRISAKYKEKPSFFISVHRKQKLRDALSKLMRKEYVRKKNKVVAADYNEFDLE